MSYVKDNLLPNEKILLTSKISNAVFLFPIMIFLFSLFFLGFSRYMGSNKGESAAVFAFTLICVSGSFLLFHLSLEL